MLLDDKYLSAKFFSGKNNPECCLTINRPHTGMVNNFPTVYRKKPILQFDQQGNLVKRHSSVTAVMGHFDKRQIVKCCKFQGQYRVGGYFWRYAYMCDQPEGFRYDYGDKMPEIDLLMIRKIKTVVQPAPPPRTYPVNRKKIIQQSLDGKFIRLWNDYKELDEIGYVYQHIVQLCTGTSKSKTGYGFLWSYAEDFI